ncbi:MAG: hypothetical protein ACI4SJ_06250 [Candidatus Avispirillum sp.]
MKKWGECIKRALRTFAEAAAAYLAAHLVYAVSTGGEDIHVLRTALMGLAVSSVAAGLAAVLNMPKKAESAGAVEPGNDAGSAAGKADGIADGTDDSKVGGESDGKTAGDAGKDADKNTAASDESAAQK